MISKLVQTQQVRKKWLNDLDLKERIFETLLLTKYVRNLYDCINGFETQKSFSNVWNVVKLQNRKTFLCVKDGRYLLNSLLGGKTFYVEK
jgi:hypothetical protein